MTSTYSEQDAVARRAIRDIDRISARGWGRTNCPFCLGRTGKSDRRRSFGFYVETQEYHCFKCGARGRLIGAPESREMISERRAKDCDEDCGPPEGYTPLWTDPGLSAEIFGPARDYLAGRGVGSQTISEARIGACYTGRQAGRVVVPALEADGSWFGWVARAWGSVGPRGLKYISSTSMDSYRRLYNESALDVETDDPAICVEGVYDALPLWPDAVAFFGKPSDGQFQRLLKARRPLVIALDGDAWIEAEMLALRLGLEGVHAGWLRLPPRRDPGDMPPDRILAAARRAVEQ